MFLKTGKSTLSSGFFAASTPYFWMVRGMVPYGKSLLFEAVAVLGGKKNVTLVVSSGIKVVSWRMAAPRHLISQIHPKF
jgi:hypothetical protein